MTRTPQQVYSELSDFMDFARDPYRVWYVGMSGDAMQHILLEVGLPSGSDWTFRECDSEEDAQNVVGHLRVLGCGTDPGGADRHGRQVYVYHKRVPGVH